MGQIDPLLPFMIGFVTEREVLESGLLMKACVGSRTAVPETSCDPKQNSDARLA